MSGPSLIDQFSALEDPRQSWKVLFPLPEVLLLVLCGTLAGAEDFVEIRRWGQMHQDFLRRLLPFKAGVPSHDTLNDVINAIDGTLFAQCFTTWVEGLREPALTMATALPEVVAIDGKTSRRTHDRSKWLCYRILAQQCWRILAHPRPLNLGSPRLDRGTWRGLESQSGFIRTASSRA